MRSHDQWVGLILLKPKIDGVHKNYLTPEIWQETHLRETFFGSLIFQRSNAICIGHYIRWHTLALQRGGQNKLLFACILINKCRIVMLRCAENDTPSSFQQFSWSLSAKFLFRKRYFIVFQGVSISIGNWRILCVLCIILQLNFDEVWLFFYSHESDMDICYVKRNYSQKCIMLALNHLLCIPK